MKEKSLKVNAVLNGIKQCCQILFPLITFPYVSRVFGNEGFGEYSFSVSITNYFVLLAALGIGTYAVREGAKIRNNQKQITLFCSQIFSINLCSAVISLVLLAALILISPKINSYGLLIAIQSLTIILVALGTDWVNSIYEDFFYITLRYIIIQVIALILMFLFVKSAEDVAIYCLISVFAASGGNLVNIVYVRRYVKIKPTWKMNIKKHLLPLLILFVNSIAVTIYVNSDITMLGFYTNDSVVGIYSFASKIYNLLKQLVTAIIVISVPRMAYILANRTEQYENYLYKIFCSLITLVLPVTVGLFCMSDSVIYLAGGMKFSDGNSALMVLSLSIIFAVCSSFFSSCILIVRGQEKKCLIATSASAVINMVLNFLLLPDLGMMGAAVTTLIAEAVNCLIVFGFSGKYFSIKKLERRQLLSAGVGSLAIILCCSACNVFFTGKLLKFFIAASGSTVAYLGILMIMKNQLAINLLENCKNRLKK